LYLWAGPIVIPSCLSGLVQDQENVRLGHSSGDGHSIGQYLKVSWFSTSCSGTRREM